MRLGTPGKRFRHQRDHEDEFRSQKKMFFDKEGPQNDELVVYRILCPNELVGSVIGKSGKVINTIRRETNARVKVVDPFPGANKRVITIYCYVDRDTIEVDEDISEPLCGAQDALLRVHDAIVKSLDNNSDSEEDGKEEAIILVPTSQTSAIIGKSGSQIKRLRSTTGAIIRVEPKDPNAATHACAMSFDNFVKITGHSDSVRRALLAISTIMLKFPPRETISLETSVPEAAPTVIIPSDLPIYPAANFYSGADANAASHPSRIPVIASIPHVPEMPTFTETVNAYPVYPSAVPVITGSRGPSNSGELVLCVLCPADKIGRVIGKGGSTIKSIRKASGARIDIDDKDNKECLITVTTRESTDDMKSGAVEAVLLLQREINDEDEEYANIRLLVPQKVVGRLIGKGGEIVNEMRKKTKAEIHISRGEKPRRASANDELVEVFGEISNLRDALVQIILRLRDDVLKEEDHRKPHREGNHNIVPVDQIYASNRPMPTLLPHAPAVRNVHYDNRRDSEKSIYEFPGTTYGYSSMQANDDSRSAFQSNQSKNYGGGVACAEMVFPASALSKVLGKGGANLENIRKISGAQIEIFDSRSSRLDCIARISGTGEQKKSAENLIKAFVMST